MARLTPEFSANRAVREYTERHYFPGAAAYLERVADKGSLGRHIVDWQHGLDQRWDSMHFGRVQVESRPDGHEFEVELFLNGMDRNAVKVQLYVDAANEGDSVAEMTMLRRAPDPGRPDVYGVTLPARRPVGDYTARVIPNHAHVSVPLEYARITWQR
jgi:starch phosphorylase